MNGLGRQYAARGLVVRAINVERDKANYQQFIKSKDYAHLQWGRDSSGEISKLYRVRGVPTTYFLDREGIIRYAHVGYGDKLKGTFVQEIESLLVPLQSGHD